MQEDTQWKNALPSVYNCYTIIKETKRMADLYRRESEKCRIIAEMLESSMLGINTFVFKITDNSIIKEMQKIGFKVDKIDNLSISSYNINNDYRITWVPEDVMKYISK
jgi:hypothetical protein